MLHNEITWLTTPASTKYHLNVEGRLLLHSVGVAETLMRRKEQALSIYLKSVGLA